MQDMKKYLNSDISCFVNAMLVVLILLASSCSSNWKYEYLKNETPRKVDGKTVGAKADTTEQYELNDTTGTENEILDPSLVDSSYVATSENEQVSVFRNEATGEEEASMNLQELVITESRISYTPVDTNGRLMMSMIVKIPKDILAADWQIRLHPTVYLRQKKVETSNFPVEDLYITGSGYRDKQIKGYEKYSNYLGKIMSDAHLYKNDINLNQVLNENVSDYVNKYQLEYFIERNFPEIYAFKNDSSYISDEKFESVLGVAKDKVIRHFYNESLENKIKKLAKDKHKNYKSMIYNPIDYSSIKGDNLVSADTLNDFDKIYSQVWEKIKESDTLMSIYTTYINESKTNKRLTYPELKSDYFVSLDSAINANGGKRIDKLPSKGNLLNFKLSDYKVEKFKLDTGHVILGDDTTKVYMMFDYSTSLDAFQFPGLDKVYIGLTGDVYNDTTWIYNFVMENRLEYPVVSVASLADTTEILYDSIPHYRKANHGANYSIEFEKNSAALKESVGNNAQVIQDIKNSLNALMKNAEFDLDSIIVSATASPEGAITVNQRFSGQRSDAVSNYFRNYVESHRWRYKHREDSIRREANESIASAKEALDIGSIFQHEYDDIVKKYEDSIKAAKMPNIEFKVHPIPENWDDLYTLVGGDSIMSYNEKEQFYNTFEKNNNLDVRENTMKKHSYYNYMSKELYPKIRVVKFEFHMHRKGQELEVVYTYEPSKRYLEGVQALREFDFIKAESILKDYPSYNAAICYIVRKKPLQAIEILEKPSIKIDFEYFKAKRDSLTQVYVGLDSSMIDMKEYVVSQIDSVKRKMDRAAKIEFLKAKAYFMKRTYEDYMDRAFKSYLFLLRVDKLNGLYSKAMTGEELKGGAVFGSNEYFEFSASTDEYLSGLPKLRIYADKIKKHKEDLVFELWNEKKKYFTAKEKEEYNNLREAYMYDDYGNIRTEEELEKVLMLEFNQ